MKHHAPCQFRATMLHSGMNVVSHVQHTLVKASCAPPVLTEENQTALRPTHGLTSSSTPSELFSTCKALFARRHLLPFAFCCVGLVTETGSCRGTCSGCLKQQLTMGVAKVRWFRDERKLELYTAPRGPSGPPQFFFNIQKGLLSKGCVQPPKTHCRSICTWICALWRLQLACKHLRLKHAAACRSTGF